MSATELDFNIHLWKYSKFHLKKLTIPKQINKEERRNDRNKQKHRLHDKMMKLN